MLKVVVFAILTLGPFVAYRVVKPTVPQQTIPVAMGMMGMWLALGSLLCLYAGYDYAMLGGYAFEFDWLNLAIILSYCSGLFANSYNMLNRSRT